MTFGGPELLSAASRITLILLLVGMGACMLRLVIGPHAADRIAALDLFSVLVVAFLAACAVFFRESSFLDVALAYALIAFLGTVALSRFLERTSGTRCGDSTETEIEP